MTEISLPSRMKSMGFNSPEELLLWIPRKYEDYSNVIATFSQVAGALGTVFVIQARIEEITRHYKAVPPRIQFKLQDSKGVSIYGTIFGNIFEFKETKIGDLLYFRAEMSEWDGGPQLKNLTRVSQDDVGKLIPIYPHKPGKVAAKTIAEEIERQLPENAYLGAHLIRVSTGLTDQQLFEQVGVKNLEAWLCAVHKPASMNLALKAQEYAKKFALCELKYKASTNFPKLPVPKSAIRISRQTVNKIIESLPYPLTGDQERAINDIVEDLISPIPAFRFINGDVGTGKTLTYSIPFIAAAMAGAKVTIMVSNTLLVEQTAKAIRKLAPNVPVHEIYAGDKIKDQFAIHVGTIALSGASKRAKYVPDILLVDEQQKLSNNQRQSFRGEHTNYFEATATAVPRSQALITNAGMAVSILRQSPVKKTVITHLVPNSGRAELFNTLMALIGQGEKVAIVYPRLKNKEGDNEKKNIVAMAQFWKQKVSCGVEVVHSDLEDDEKKVAIENLRSGRSTLLISTTILEVGIDIPSLRAIMIVNADRYGYSQLHQLRGRVARDGGTGYAYLYLPDQVPEETFERLKVLESVNDGFELAKVDMQNRGYGDLAEDSDDDNGITRTLFKTIKLSAQDLESILPSVE